MEWMVLIGAVAGIYVLKLLSPLLLASAQKSQTLTDLGLLARIHKRLARSGLPALQVEIWPAENDARDNAMVVGMISAPRFFRARIFISSSLLKNYSAEELDCVMAHEVAHFQMNHLSKRIWIPFSFYTLIVFGGTLATREHLLVVLPLALLGYVLAFSVLLRRLVRAQELDADWMAVQYFNVDRELYFRTLSKMESPHTVNISHPSVSERRDRVTAASVTAPPFELEVFKAWIGPVTGLILVIALSGYFFHRDPSQTSREPATQTKDSP
jgi:Zn-dependent protease with chaperone function